VERLRGRYAPLTALAVATLIAVTLIALPGSARSSASPHTALGAKLTHLRSHRCGSKPVVDCGYANVPLDWKHTKISPRIRLAYKFWPATDHHARSTIVAVEGGPGYASIGSSPYYRIQYGSDLRTHNLLIVDNRGTGGSTPVNCPKLQKLSPTATPGQMQNAAFTCGRGLDHRWKYTSGGWVHAADMFGTVPAANDMAALIEDLHTGPVSIYGDSYGTYFAQVFSEQHPQLVKDAVLDSAYQVHHLGVWYASTMSGLRQTVNIACSHALACRARIHNAWKVVGRLVRRLDVHPASAIVPNAAGARRRVTVTAVGMVNLLSDAGADVYIYRQLAAAAEAVVQRHDAAPLARLYAQRLAVDESYRTTPYKEYSAGLYVATSCTDYPQLFSMQSSFSARLKQLKARMARVNPKLFAPFTVRQWLAQNFNTEALTVCLKWPHVDRDREAPQVPAKHLAKHVPVLILSGKLDIWTPAAGDHMVANQVGGHVRIVHFANSTHVVADQDTVCGDQVVGHFTEHPFGRLNASCAPKVAAIHALGVFPGSLSAVPELGHIAAVDCNADEICATTTSASKRVMARDRRLAVAAIDTAGDAVERWEAISRNHDLGLYGGRVTASHGGSIIRLAGDELVPGLKVSGTIRVRNMSAGGYSSVTATLRVRDRSGQSVAVGTRWTKATGAHAHAVVRTAHAAFTGTTSAP
jgi:pimeloyl-ACP methyl ester carboxylesterase